MTIRFPFWPTVLVALAVAAMCGLGIWQIQRAQWKDELIAQYAAARGKPEIAFPTIPIAEPYPLFRRATGHCLQVTGWREVAGRNAAGEVGYSHLAACSTGAEGPGMTVDAGWSKDPSVKADWSGGPVTGTIGTDVRTKIRLVSVAGLGGLEASAPPSTDEIPDNHVMYAITWFTFAVIALVIYILALRSRQAKAAGK